MLLPEGKIPSKPHQMHICFDLDNVSKPLFQWQMKSFVQWPLTWALIPQCLLSKCLFTHFATNVGDCIQISKFPNIQMHIWRYAYQRGHLSHVALLLLTSLPWNCSFKNHLSTCWKKCSFKRHLSTSFQAYPFQSLVRFDLIGKQLEGGWEVTRNKVCSECILLIMGLKPCLWITGLLISSWKVNPPEGSCFSHSKTAMFCYLFSLPRWKGEGQCSPHVPRKLYISSHQQPCWDPLAGKTAPLLLLSFSSREPLLKIFCFWCICID